MFVLSVDGILGKVAQVVLATLSQLMAAKMEEPISYLKGLVNSRIEIAFARFYYQMLHRDRVPSPLRNRDPNWESVSGLVLAQ